MRVIDLLRSLTPIQVNSILVEQGSVQPETITNVHHIGDAEFIFTLHDADGGCRDMATKLFVDGDVVRATKPRGVDSLKGPISGSKESEQ